MIYTKIIENIRELKKAKYEWQTGEFNPKILTERLKAILRLLYIKHGENKFTIHDFYKDIGKESPSFDIELDILYKRGFLKKRLRKIDEKIIQEYKLTEDALNYAPKYVEDALLVKRKKIECNA